jgi:hypothetical protein
MNFLTDRNKLSPVEGLRGTGVRRDPLGEARDCTLRRDGGSTLGHLRAVVTEDLQIVN